MKKLAFVILLTAGLFACNSNPGVKKTISDKKKTDTVKKDSTAAKQESKSNFLDIPGGMVDMATAKKAFDKGVKLYGAGKLDEAIEQFNIVLKNNKANSVALHYLGRIYHDKGEKKRAISYYEEAARNNINDSVSILYIGQIYFEMGDKKMQWIITT